MKYIHMSQPTPNITDNNSFINFEQKIFLSLFTNIHTNACNVMCLLVF